MLTYRANLHFLLHSAELVEDLVARRLGPLNVRPRQALVIEALWRMGSASQVELAKQFEITPASMSTMTSRLIAGGFITARTNPSSTRAKILQLTSKGEELVAEIYGAWKEVDEMISERLGQQRAAAMFEHTRALRDNLGGKVPGRQHPDARKSSKDEA